MENIQEFWFEKELLNGAHIKMNSENLQLVREEVLNRTLEILGAARQIQELKGARGFYISKKAPESGFIDDFRMELSQCIRIPHGYEDQFFDVLHENLIHLLPDEARTWIKMVDDRYCVSKK